jgi:hypothetical protein
MSRNAGDILETLPPLVGNAQNISGNLRILVAGARNHHYLQLWHLVA